MKSIKSEYPDSFNQAPFKQKVALIFQWLGYEIDWNRCFQTYQVDLFIKKKKLFNGYEYWICLIDTGESKLEKDSVSNLVKARNAAREELKQSKHNDVDCQGMIICENSFTNEAISEAKLHQIELATLEILITNLEGYMLKKEILKEEILRACMETVHKE